MRAPGENARPGHGGSAGAPNTSFDLVAEWGDQIAEEIKPLEVQKWLVSLRTTQIKDVTGRVINDGLSWSTISKLRGTMNQIYEVGKLYGTVVVNPVEIVKTSSKSKYKAIKLTPAQTLSVLKQLMDNPLHFTFVFTVAATALGVPKWLRCDGRTSTGMDDSSGLRRHERSQVWMVTSKPNPLSVMPRWGRS